MSLPRILQRRLCDYYGLDGVPDVEPFLHAGPEVLRERVLVLEEGNAIEVRVEIPAAALGPEPSLDLACQVVEGISHFVLIAERARCELPTTQLELELQAEVDKFLLLGVLPEPLPSLERARLRLRLFEITRFVDEPGTLLGDRYRLASRTADRYLRRLETKYLDRSRWRELRGELNRFFRAGQTAKLELARAA